MPKKGTERNEWEELENWKFQLKNFDANLAPVSMNSFFNEESLVLTQYWLSPQRVLNEYWEEESSFVFASLKFNA